MLFLICLCGSSNAQFKVVGYIWSRSSMTTDLKKLDLSKITHLNIAFINPDTSGKIEEVPALDTVVRIAQQHGVKVLISCGGGSRQAYYSRLLTDAYRKHLVSNFIAFVDRYRLDGFDVDLEGDDIDQNYEAFILDLRQPLTERKKLFTSAVAWWTRDRLSDLALAQFDFINIMAYDKTGPWNPDTAGQHSPLSYAQDHFDYWRKERHLSKDKLVLGLPFYGYGFGRLPESDRNYQQMSWNELQQRYPDKIYDDELIYPEHGGTFYYNGMKTIREKTQLAKDLGNGVMIWQLLYDSFNRNSLIDVIDRTHRGANIASDTGRRTVDETPFGINGRLKLVGTQLSNQLWKGIQLKGMSTHGLQYRGNCYNDESLELLAQSWRADILRISMYVQEGGYETVPARYTQMVDKMVDKCFQLGIYALIDWHMLHPGDPNANTELAKVFFEHVAKKHGNKGNVLYEICNEPNDKEGKVTWARIRNYAENIIPVIRKHDAQSIIIVGTPENASRPDLVIENPLTQDNIMYTMHFYAGDHYEKNHQVKRRNYVSKAISNGLPVFVTEFGTQNGWGDGPNDFTESQRWLDFMKENRVSWCNWNYSDSPLSGAVWKTGTCPNGPWTDNNLKASGKWIRARLRDFTTNIKLIK